VAVHPEPDQLEQRLGQQGQPGQPAEPAQRGGPARPAPQAGRLAGEDDRPRHHHTLGPQPGQDREQRRRDRCPAAVGTGELQHREGQQQRDRQGLQAADGPEGERRRARREDAPGCCAASTDDRPAAQQHREHAADPGQHAEQPRGGQGRPPHEVGERLDGDQAGLL
jgi:hypothetical protein